MNDDWQSWTALAVIALTIVGFVVRACRKKRGGGCDDCGSKRRKDSKDD